jgi:opacity protein-like surface antigen
MKRLLAICVAAASIAASAAATGHEVYVKYGEGMNAIPWWAHPTLLSMRCQMLFDQSYIAYPGTITEFKLEKSDTLSTTFKNVKFYLCHTGLSYLTTSFQGNYDGRTPKMVASFADYTLPAVQGVYPIPMAETFGYNNTDNLILEVTWEASDLSNTMCRIKSGAVDGHRCFAWDYKATVGQVSRLAYNGLIVFDKYPGVVPASLGRVKVLYR